MGTLPPHITQMIRDLFAGGGGLRAHDLVRLILAMKAAGVSEAMIGNVLAHIVQAGRASIVLVERALSMAGAGLVGSGSGAAAGGTAGGSAATGGAAGGAAAAGAILVAAVAVGIAIWRINDEADTSITFPDGVLCTCAEGCGKELTAVASRPGSRWATNLAKVRAMRKTAEVVTCAATACDEPGKVCAPIPTFIDVDPRYRGLWTTTVIRYKTSCKCVSLKELLGAAAE